MNFNTPATLHKGNIRNQGTEKNISYNLGKGYRIGVGSLLYLVKYSLQELSNGKYELYKYTKESNTSHYKALIRAIKYVIDKI